MDEYPMDSKCYQMGEVIGIGLKSTVYKAYCISKQFCVVAIKVIEFQSSQKWEPNILIAEHEARVIHTLVSHPNILRPHGIFRVGTSLWVVMPFLSGGSLLSIMADSGHGLAEECIAPLLKGICSALFYLHQRGQVHRDVKPGNILVDSDGSVKLGDLGYSVSAVSYLEWGETPPYWWSPERCLCLASDIWSVGVTALELAYGGPPVSVSNFPPCKFFIKRVYRRFGFVDGTQLMDDRKKKKIEFSKCFKNLVALCLDRNSSKRPSAEELMEHEFFKKFDSSKYMNMIRKEIGNNIVREKVAALRFEAQVNRLMMATDSANPVSGVELGNGLHEPLQIFEKVNGTSNGSLGVEELSANLEDTVKLRDHSLGSDKEISEEPALQSECYSTVRAEALEVKESSDSKNSKSQKGTGRTKNGKSLSPRQGTSVGLSKSKDGKSVPKSSVASNGTVPSESVCGKAPALKTKGKSFNERQAADSPKATSVQTVTKQQQHRHPDATSSSASKAQPEDLTEVTKPKVLKKGTVSNAEEISESSLAISEEAKQRKLGTLPAYNFNFKCDERTEKRRELEEKIHAKEVEKSTIQAKTKETQEAEIKRLRKSLGFKATPMPSFYQEPAPPKVELKKIPTTRVKSPNFGRKKNSSTAESEENDIPTTRAKSPKLGRKKNSSTAESEENDVPIPIACPSRLSLDEKLSKGTVARTQPPVVHVKRPLPKSLPKLPSESTSLSGEKKKATSHKTMTSKLKEESGHDLSEAAPAQKLEDGPNESEMCIDNEAAVEAQEQTSLVQEAIAL